MSFIKTEKQDEVIDTLLAKDYKYFLLAGGRDHFAFPYPKLCVPPAVRNLVRPH